MSEFGRVCDRRKLRVNCGRKGERLEVVDCFKFLGSQVVADGGCERDVAHRMNEEYRAWRVLKGVLSNRLLGIKAKRYLYERVIVPTSLYRAEAMGMRSGV